MHEKHELIYIRLFISCFLETYDERIAAVAVDCKVLQ